jgi:hypothetical protein
MMNPQSANANPADRRQAGYRDGMPPRDLREGLGESRLVRLVLDSVAATNLASLEPPKTFRNPEGIGALPLLSLVTYAYASGRQSSDEIEEAARQDRALAYLAAGQLPSSPTIRRFRRAFSPTITRTLHRVLLGFNPPGSHPSPDNPPPASEAVLLDEARRRVDAAVLADTIALDY